jgi:penicillin-binding protein 1C
MLFTAFAALGDLVPAAPPPPATLLVEASALPSPLRRFRGDRQAEAVQIAFPPQGAVLSVGARDLVVKLRGGTPPFTVLADGRPVALRLYRRETVLPPPGPGFVTLSVIDALGTSGHVSFELR